jgi:hypothetical protein
MGDFNYDELADVRPEAAPLFSAFYVAVMVFVVLCVFIAILTKYYEVVSNEMKKENELVQKELLDVVEFFRDFRLWVSELCGQRSSSKWPVVTSLHVLTTYPTNVTNCLYYNY